MMLFRNVVPREWFEEMASFVPVTLLSEKLPLPPKLNMPIEAGSPCTFDTLSWWKLKVPPLEA